MSEPDSREQVNKACVLRFNRDVIERGDATAAQELLAPDFVNRTARPGFSPGPDGITHFLFDVLRKGLSDVRVEVHQQVAEGDLVTTRKTITGRHTGELLGHAASGKTLRIDVIDIVRVRDGRYVEHWGINTLATALADLSAGTTERR
jgi:predicted SnoaL-like aldol condensation-catalyzing enzyme